MEATVLNMLSTFNTLALFQDPSTVYMMGEKNKIKLTTLCEP